ncbi:hypothetical protein MPER_07866, partial [Moniliophthora perniciosa FA553]
RAAVATKDKLLVLESLFAPVRKLPPELLSLIFTHSVETNKLDLEHPHHSRSEASDLAAVCYHWRNVALATPDIWASITFLVHVGMWQADCRVISLLKTHIERSQHAHLAIEILYNPENYVSFKLDAAIVSISKVLEAHFHRCTSFRLVVEPGAAIRAKPLRGDGRLVEPSYYKLILPRGLQDDSDLENDDLAVTLRSQIERAVVTENEDDIFDDEIEGRVNRGVPYIRPSLQSLTIEVGKFVSDRDFVSADMSVVVFTGMSLM